MTMDETTIIMGALDCEPEKPPVKFDLAGASDIGSVRQQNQDHYMIAELRRQLSVISTDVPLESCDELYGSEPGQLLLVADGMGGHSDGELASNMAVQVCARYVLDMMHWFLKLSASDEDDFIDELSQSLSSAQQALWSHVGGGRGPDGNNGHPGLHSLAADVRDSCWRQSLLRSARWKAESVNQGSYHRAENG